MTKKILMLGWEFPPLINGGLGIACYGIAKALAKKADVSLIIPKAETNFVVENVELIGLNDTRTEELVNDKALLDFKDFLEVDYVKANIMPYQSVKTKSPATTEKKELKYLDDLNFFKHEDVYGGDILSNVMKYTNAAVHIALNKEFDVIHAHDWMTFFAGMQIKSLTGKPLVLHVHSTEVDRSSADNKGVVYEIERKGFEEANAIIAVSQFTANVIEEHYHIDGAKIKVCHNGIDRTETFRKARINGEKLVLYLGRLVSQKGPEFFLQTATKVIEEIPEVRFVMAGTGDSLKHLIEEGASRQIGSKFHFTGFLNQEKVKQLYSMADVYVMPSVSEPFGLSALEAAQFGVPCVLSKQSGVSEVMPNALLADFWDTDLMARHIVDLLRNRILKDYVVNTTYNDIENLTWDNTAEKILKVLQEL
ncbi:MAG TPA: glycosyltransferase family 1 protein [Cytophagales bacterium]|nr:glycosyltransferase family 1 protein [Cytophagales bacterium]